MKTGLINVWNYGGGVQSCAIAVLILKGQLPVPEVALIADTGREKQSTWSYLREHVAPALKGIGLEVNIAPHSLARVDVWGANETLLLPAFTMESGAVGKLPTYCSTEWKRRTCARYLSSRGIKPRQRRDWIGFSLDEARRIMRLQNSKKGKFFFPLAEAVPMRRQDCIALVEKFGWPTPPRSACWMCPNMNHSEWQGLKENSPREFAQAVALEVKVREKDPNAFFHRTCKPLDEVDFEREPDLFSRPCDSGMCFT